MANELRSHPQRLHHGADTVLQVLSRDDLFRDGVPFSALAYHVTYSRVWGLEEVHAGVELGIVLSGEQHFLYHDVSRHLRQGDIWLVAPWEPHGAEFQPGDLEEVVVCVLPEFLGEETLGGISWLGLCAVPPAQRPQVVDEAMRKQVLTLGRRLYEEISEKPLDWSNGVRLNLLNLLLALRRGWEPPREVISQPDYHAGNLLRIQPVMAALHADPALRTNEREAAAMCKLSPAQFRRVFRRTMGISFGQFRLRSRLIAASNLLLSNQWTVEAIAEHTGFADAPHLHRAFVRRYGCTPAVHRRRFRG